MGGAEFFRNLGKLAPPEREEAIAAELCRGNLPEFLRRFCQVTVHGNDATGKDHTAIIEVMPDYLAIGNEQFEAPLTRERVER